MATLAGLTKPAVVHVIPGMATTTGGRQLHILVRGLFMAGQAIDAFVATIEFKSGALIVIVVPDFPATGVVAQATIGPQTPFMFVILQVTGDAGHLRILIRRRSVAFLALHILVFAEQGEFRQIVIEFRAGPGTLVMALHTVLAFLTFVLVVFLMTGVAEAVGLVFVHNSLMTGLALDRYVFAHQGIFCLPVMIENHLGPVFFHVAIFTLAAEFTFVFIVFLMALHADGRGLVFI